MEQEAHERNLRDKSFEQAVAEAHERMTRELMEAVSEREERLAGNTASSLIEDIADDRLKAVVASMLLLVKTLSLFDLLKDRDLLNQLEYEELYAFVVTLHQKVTYYEDPWHLPTSQGSSDESAEGSSTT